MLSVSYGEVFDVRKIRKLRRPDSGDIRDKSSRPPETSTIAYFAEFRRARGSAGPFPPRTAPRGVETARDLGPSVGYLEMHA